MAAMTSLGDVEDNLNLAEWWDERHEIKSNSRSLSQEDTVPPLDIMRDICVSAKTACN